MEDFNETKVIHQIINGKYRVVFERSAVKGVDGFKVEANGDTIDAVLADAEGLYKQVIHVTLPPTMEVR
jgi:hypothetical protein